jgi:hypothetical protein
MAEIASMRVEAFAWSNRSGVLIARAWQESICDGVRVRVIWAADEIGEVSAATPNVIVVDSREALLAVVAGWLERIADAPPEN